MKRLIRLAVLLTILAVAYALGPSPKRPDYVAVLPAFADASETLDATIARMESRHQVKPDNHARIVWADSSKTRTEYSIVYLHGFSASQMEGDPTHRRLAKAFGCNLYLARIADHGVDTTESLLYFTAERAWKSAREALAIGKQIGEKVIVLSTSTGGTLALKLAAEFPSDVHALVNLSPNIEINNPAAFLLNDPWGLYIARAVMQGKYRDTGASEEKSRYWTAKYRLESVVQLQELLETTMLEETFNRIHQPSLTLYYYKDENQQDPEVKVSAMLRMHKQLATPDSLKVEKAIPTAEAHVLGGSLASKDVETVYDEIEKFFQTQLSMRKR